MRSARRRRVDWQEHVRAEPADGFVAAAGRDCDVDCAGRRRRGRCLRRTAAGRARAASMRVRRMRCVAPRQMDASRCIAYLTIEKKGSIAARSLREKMGRQVFGCDICQDVCPWNGRAPIAQEGALPARDELGESGAGMAGGMDGPAFNRWFRGSPLERTGRKRLLRNVAIAMGNSGEREFLPRLRGVGGGRGCGAGRGGGVGIASRLG